MTTFKVLKFQLRDLVRSRWLLGYTLLLLALTEALLGNAARAADLADRAGRLSEPPGPHGDAAAAMKPPGTTQWPCITVARCRLATRRAACHPAAIASGAAAYAAPRRLTSARSADAYPNTLSALSGA